MPGPRNPKNKKTPVPRFHSPKQRGLGRKDAADELRARAGPTQGDWVAWMAQLFGERLETEKLSQDH